MPIHLSLSTFCSPCAAIAGLSLLFIRTAEREKRLQSLDENAIKDIVGIAQDELDADRKKAEEAKNKQLQKAKYKVQQRLASEKKAEARKANSTKKKKKGGGGDDTDDDEDLSVFAKASTKKKS